MIKGEVEKTHAQQVASKQAITCTVDSKKRVKPSEKATRYSKVRTSCGELIIKRNSATDTSTAKAKMLAARLKENKTYNFVAVKVGNRLHVIDVDLVEQ